MHFCQNDILYKIRTDRLKNIPHLATLDLLDHPRHPRHMVTEIDLFSCLSHNKRVIDILASTVQTNGNSGQAAPVVVNALPEGLNIEELLEDIKKLKATVRKQGRRIAKLEQAAEGSG